MNSREILATIHSMGQQDLCVTLTFLAEEVYGAKLAGGSDLRDAGDFAAWLRELAEVAKFPSILGSTEGHAGTGRSTATKVTRFDRSPVEFCPECGHIHADDSECGFPQGGQRKCLCERKVMV